MAHKERSTRRDGGEFYGLLTASELEEIAATGGPFAVATAVALRMLAGESGSCCAPTLDRLRRLTGCGRDSQASALDRLEECGFLTRDSVGGRATEITLTTTGVAALAARPIRNSDRKQRKSDGKPRKSDCKPRNSDTRLQIAIREESDSTAAPLAPAGAGRGASGGEEVVEALPSFSEIFRKGRESLGAMKHAEPIAGDELAARRAELERQRAEILKGAA